MNIKAINSVWRGWAISITTLLVASCVDGTLAQITPDATLKAESSTVTPNVVINDILSEQIDGGAIRGVNLFHSLQEFNVGEGRGAYFTNPTGIENILTRVTGGNTSNILGTLGVLGNANLFLMNPNGIIFGPNSRLDVRGSFVASTANSLNFADGIQFSATNPQAPPLLNISVPLGLQYGGSAALVVNQSRATNSSGEIVGLQLQPGRTLALVGGDVALEGGYVTVLGGRIELGSVAGSGLVSLTPTNQGLAMGYKGVQTFRDVRLSQQALVDANDDGQRSGNIQVQGATVTLTDKSNIVANNILGSQEAGGISINAERLVLQEGAQVSASTLGAGRGGDLNVNAEESVELLGATSTGPFPGNLFVFGGYAPSSLITRTQGDGNAGNLTIQTRQLITKQGGLLSASTFGGGKGGTLTVRALDSVDLIGPSPNFRVLGTGLFAQAARAGDGGALIVETNTLTVRDEAQVSASTFNAGKGGDLVIRASEVNISRSGGLFAQVGSRATGNGGNLTIDTDRLRVEDGGLISIGTATGSTGRAGTLTAIAREYVEVSGRILTPNGMLLSSTLFGLSAGTGGAGDLKIETGKLIVRDGGLVTVSGRLTANAGNLEIAARSINLDNQGTITATSAAGDRGNITLATRDVQLRHQSSISTNASGSASGGNINIDTETLVALENSNITANAEQGSGGNIQINTQGFFLSPDSAITASSQTGINGVVQINRPDVDPSGGLIQLPENPIEASDLVAQGCAAAEGNTFAIAGRGGMPPSPSDLLGSNRVWVDLREPLGVSEHSSAVRRQSPINPQSSSSTEVVEAQGWVISRDGKVMLTAKVPKVTPYGFAAPPQGCHTANN